MFGNVNLEMGKVSMVVDIGTFCQLQNDSLMIRKAPVKPPTTTSVQRTLENFLELEMYDRPWIVDVSKNTFI